MKKFLVLLIVLLLAISLSACGNDKVEDDPEANPAVDSAQKNDTAANPDTDKAAKIELPKSYPTDILPLIKDAEVTAASTYTGTGGKIKYSTDKSLEAVADFYDPILEQYKGFGSKVDEENYDAFARTEGYNITVHATAKSGFSEVTVIARPLKKLIDLDKLID